MKYRMTCSDCDWTAEADKMADVVDLMVEHEARRLSDAQHCTNYYGPKNSWGSLSWAQHVNQQQKRLAAGRARAKLRREGAKHGPRNLSDMFNLAGSSRPKVRDTQRQKLYDAEVAAKLWGRHFRDVPEMQAFVDKVMKSAYVNRRYRRAGACYVRVVRKGGYGGRVHQVMRRNSYELWMPDSHDVWSVMYVLHELAHVLEDFTEEGRKEADHGRTFVRVYLGLVKRFMGPDVEFGLKAQFRAAGIKWQRRAVRAPMTPEEKAVVARRLAAAREAKAAK